MPDRPSNADRMSRRSFLTFATTGAGVVAAGYAGWKLLRGLAPSADVVAQSDGLMVKLSDIPEGTEIVVNYLGRPVIVRHRTAEEVALAEAADPKEFPDNTTRDVFERFLGDASDYTRRSTPDGRFIALSGVEPYKGCVVLKGGDWEWFDPCVSTHFDISGRARKYGFRGNLRLPVQELMGTDRLRLITNPNYLKKSKLDDLLYQ